MYHCGVARLRIMAGSGVHAFDRKSLKVALCMMPGVNRLFV